MRLSSEHRSRNKGAPHSAGLLWKQRRSPINGRLVHSYLLLLPVICLFVSLLLNFFLLLSPSAPINNHSLLSSTSENRPSDGLASTTHNTATKDALRENANKKKNKNNPTSMSACLLIKDDNSILDEWIAYHYHVLKLRYIVVAVDPSRREAPDAIFAKWQEETDLSVTIWSDPDFFPKPTLNEISRLQQIQNRTEFEFLKEHRFRQRFFYSFCVKHMMENKKTWVMHIDTDEYIAVNPFLRKANGRVDGGTIKVSKTTATHQAVFAKVSPKHNVTLEIPSYEDSNVKDVPVLDRMGYSFLKSEPSSIFHFLEQVNDNPFLRQVNNYPCISMPRLMFGSLPETGDLYRKSKFKNSLGYTYRNLQTQQWTFHGPYNNKKLNASPKVLLDASKLNASNIMFKPWKKVGSIHRPDPDMCAGVSDTDMTATERFPLIAHHYLGSWEQYNSREDIRRNKETYDKKGGVRFAHNSWVASWLRGFVESVGPCKAERLLDRHYFGSTAVPSDDQYYPPSEERVPGLRLTCGRYG